MGFNIGAGLSQMGSAISNTAGAAALEMQKSDLENQKEVLANQLATTRETTLESQRQAGAQTLAAGEHQFQTGLESQKEKSQAADIAMQLASSEKIASGSQATTLKAANIEAGASMANVQAQIKAGALETGIDAKTGNTVITNKLLGTSTPLTDPDGNPLQLTNPAMAQLARQVVLGMNEQIRASTQQYHTDIVSAQKDISDALRAAGGDETDKDVVAARAREQDIRDKFGDNIATLKSQANDAINAAVHPGGAAQPTGNKPPLSAFDRAPTAPTVPASNNTGATGLSGLLNNPAANGP